MKKECVGFIYQDLNKPYGFFADFFLFSREECSPPVTPSTPNGHSRKIIITIKNKKTKTKVWYLIIVSTNFAGTSLPVTRSLRGYYYSTTPHAYAWSCINNCCDTWSRIDAIGVDCAQHPGLAVFFIDQIQQAIIFFVIFFQNAITPALCFPKDYHVPSAKYLV